MTDQAAIERFLESYSAAWAGIVAPPILAHWDRERFQYYKAEEVKRFFHDVAGLEAYLVGNEALHEAVTLDFREPVLRPLAGPYLIVTLRLDWRISFRADAPGSLAGALMAGDNHVLALFTTDGAEPRLAGWSETPDAAITYMRDLYAWRAKVA